MSDVCTCGHTEAWHIGTLFGGRWTQHRACAVDGCPCGNYVSAGRAA